MISMRKAMLLTSLLLLVPSVMADYGTMMGGTGWFGAGLIGWIYFAVGAFVFSAIFWLTHNWRVKPRRKK
ncbi:hypothetical protein HQ545_06660 [Candidatus Woesearchaeota archaeon]|nr:hypothetical protein [Candidatus Woesearchaeota archaeon]